MVERSPHPHSQDHLEQQSIQDRITLNDGRVTLHDHEGVPFIQHTVSSLTLVDGRQFSTEGHLPVVEANHETCLLRFEGTKDYPEIVRKIENHPSGGITLQVGLINTTSEDLPLRHLSLCSSSIGIYGTMNNEIQISQMGYQAQSPIHPPLPLDRHERMEFSSRRPECQQGPLITQENSQSVTVPWMSRVTIGERKLLLGFVTAKQYAGAISFSAQENDVLINVWNDGEDLVIPALNPHHPQKSIVMSEKFLLLPGTNELEMLPLYAASVAKEMSASPNSKTLTGWGSWYREYPPLPNITEDIILKNAAKVSALKDNGTLPLEVCEVDDGYQQDIGQWETNDKFPHGHSRLTQDIKEQGLKPSLWIVPFAASDSTEVFHQHPEWFVKDEDNEPKVAKYHGGWDRNLYSLDVTHPEARDWMVEEFRKLKNYGYESIKADFTYLMSLKGKRYDPTVTGIEAFRLGMKVTADAFGDVDILGCQGPTLPSVGLVHANRVGHDIKATWEEPGNSSAHSSLKHAIAATQQAWWMNNILWQNDPDCLIARAHNTELTEDETKSWLTTLLLANGVMKVSDDLTELEPERLDLLKKVFDLKKSLTDQTGMPIGPYDKEGLLSERVIVKQSDEQIAAIFNWDDEERIMRFDPQDWGFTEQEVYSVREHWTNQQWQGRGSFEFPPTPPHGCLLLSIKKQSLAGEI